ncbi:MAG: tetratricopeptide repeat protein, partial [Proteobacteria bacterium]|nr:tetratricopeptide repeat protein [Pseudomonadota bacterium]
MWVDDANPPQYVQTQRDTVSHLTINVQSKFAAALALQHAGEMDSAKAHYREILNAVPDHVGTLVGLANLLAAENKLDEALIHGQRAAAIAPEQPDVLRSVGLIHIKRSDAAQARKYLLALTATAPGDAEATFYLGTLAQAQGRDQEAADYYAQAIVAAPNVPEIHNNLAMALLNLKHQTAAISALNKAIELRPDFAAAWNSLGNAHEATGNFEAAVTAYSTALRHDSTLVAAWLNRAQLRIELGDLERAADEIGQHLRDNPDDPVALNALGLLHQRGARHAEAIAVFRRAIELRENYLQAINNLAISLMSTGRHEDAVELYELAADLAPDRAEAHANLGHVFQSLGRHQESSEAFRRALASDPALESVLPFLAHALMYLCEWADLEAVVGQMLDSLARRKAAGETVSAPPFGLAGTPASPELRLAVARSVSREIARTMQGQALTAGQPATARAHEKLRIGYVSPDFREHSLGMVFQSLLAAHSRDDFLWYGYSVSPR